MTERLPNARPLRSRWFYLILLAYFSVHFVVRLSISATVNHDEAEQILYSQSLKLGYSVQPPLFTWLAWGFFQVFGLSIATLTLLRWLVLATTYVLVYLIARSVIQDRIRACFASLSLWMIICFTWQFLRDQSHTPLACALSAATYYVVLQLTKRRTLIRYVLLGVVVGLGLLAKYNFALVVAAIFLATLLQARRVILDRRLLVSILVAVAVVLPHLLWMLDHVEPIKQYLHEKTGAAESQGTWPDFLAAVGSLALNLFLVLGGVAGAYLILFHKELLRRRANAPANPQERFLNRTLLVMLLILVLMPLLTQQRRYANHWLTPFALLAPVAVLARLPRREQAPVRYRILAGTLAATVLGYVIAHGCLAAKYRGRDELFLARSENVAGRLESASAVICDDEVVAANLRLLYPHPRYYSVTSGAFDKASVSADRVLVIWDASRHDAPTECLKEHLLQRHAMRLAGRDEHQWVRAKTEPPWVIHSLGLAEARYCAAR